ncbi:MAG: radical SAM protein [Candidatus Omnitrophica bacterium]|nr:radical SAM protein [Candidatus Omnitrophota bacterium]
MEKINQLVLKGIRDGKHAYVGPKIVQIDLTGKCNNNCIGCWVHSPFIKNPPRDKNISLPFAKVNTLIEDLVRLGTEEVFLSGAGEPFLHHNILEIIELIKRKRLKLNIITNFSLIDEKIAKRLIDLGVDMVTASIWAGSPETYIKTHPSKREEDFYKIKDNLKRLSQLKIRENKYRPHIKIYNVICNLNYREIQQMIDFALDTQAELIEFQIMDIIEEETSFLALLPMQVKEIKEQFDALTKRNDLCFKELGLFNLKASIEEELKEFSGRFIRIPLSFLLKEWTEHKDGVGEEALHSLICPKGFATLPTKVNPLINEVDNKITFKFLKENCKKCSQFKSSCSVDENSEINFNFLRIFSFGSFMRRLNSSNIYNHIYERGIIDNIPCYIGWIYSRVLSTGEVIPCCKAAFKPLGDIHKNSFLHIWDSCVYQEFRYKAKFLSKSNPYFKKINCYKSCDNVSMNLRIKESISLSKKKQNLNYQLPAKKEVEGKRVLPNAKVELVIPAGEFKSGNLNIQEHRFGKGIVIDGGKGFGFAEYKIHFKESGKYELRSYYATEELRAVELYFDGTLITKEALNSTTSGWTTEDLRWFKESILDVYEGEQTLRIYTKGLIPHIHSFAFLKGVKDTQRKSRRYLSQDVYQQSFSLRLLKDKFRTLGFINFIFKLLNHIGSGRFIKNYLDILGIYSGRYAFKGPFHVQIDLTNSCNNTCIACWCNSPLLKEKRLSKEEKEQYLPLGLVRELLDEISRMGATEIYYSGGGEPFMHPQIMEILKYTKKKGLTCHVNTNFTLLDKNKIDCLIDLGVDFLTVSVWAGTPEVYCRVHPGRTEDDFYRVRENLIYLNKEKKQKFNKPLIKIYEVIFNMNYFEIEEMIKFSEGSFSESIEFTLADTVPGATDILRLDKKQAEELVEAFRNIKIRLNKNDRFPSGLLLFQFDQFLRRISRTEDVKEAKYDRNIIDSMPCYIGWLFARIIPNGQVHSCLKAHRIPTGSLYLNRFSEIWNSKEQMYFRKKTLVYQKNDSFFRFIGNDPNIKEAGCYKSCDDIGRNTWMHNRIKMLTLPERLVIKSVVKILKTLRKLKPYKDDYKKYHKDPLIAGILHGRKAFIGPEQVVIDPTNKCNLHCVSCWLYSPLLVEDRPTKEWLKKELPKEMLIRLIDDLASLGTKRIRFTGGGEPFIYKDLMEVIEYARRKQLLVAVTTNFGLVSKRDIKRLIDIGLDELCISIWASNPEIYGRVHSGVSFEYFEKLKENLLYLKEIKKDTLRVSFANVIMNNNFRDLYGMYEFGLQYGADSLYFTPMDVFSGQTDKLVMNEQERRRVLEWALEIKERSKKDKVQLEFFDGFLKRLSVSQQHFEKGEYDKCDVDKIPCYVGWVFSRILADGSVAPCCRGVKKIMGNINKKSFKEIWFSPQYNEFRAKAKYLSKSNSYFKDIGCIKECDNLMHNEEMHKRILKLSYED